MLFAGTYPRTRYTVVYYVCFALAFGWSLAILHDLHYLTTRHFYELVTVNLLFYALLAVNSHVLPKWSRVKTVNTFLYVALLTALFMRGAAILWAGL